MTWRSVRPDVDVPLGPLGRPVVNAEPNARTERERLDRLADRVRRVESSVREHAEFMRKFDMGVPQARGSFWSAADRTEYAPAEPAVRVRKCPAATGYAVESNRCTSDPDGVHRCDVEGGGVHAPHTCACGNRWHSMTAESLDSILAELNDATRIARNHKASVEAGAHALAAVAQSLKGRP